VKLKRAIQRDLAAHEAFRAEVMVRHLAGTCGCPRQMVSADWPAPFSALDTVTVHTCARRSPARMI